METLIFVVLLMVLLAGFFGFLFGFRFGEIEGEKKGKGTPISVTNLPKQKIFKVIPLKYGTIMVESDGSTTQLLVDMEHGNGQTPKQGSEFYITDDRDGKPAIAQITQKGVLVQG